MQLFDHFRIESMVVSGMSTVLVCGDAHGMLSLRAIWSLLPLRTIDHSPHGAIKCLSFTEGTRKAAIALLVYKNRHCILIIIFLRILPFFLRVCAYLLSDLQYLLIGSGDGSFSIATDPDAQWQILHAAIQKTPLLGPPI